MGSVSWPSQPTVVNADASVLCARQEPDALRFPLSLLTAAALLHGVWAVLVRSYTDAAPWYLCELCCYPSDGRGDQDQEAGGPSPHKAKKVNANLNRNMGEVQQGMYVRADREVADLRRNLVGVLGTGEVSRSVTLSPPVFVWLVVAPAEIMAVLVHMPRCSVVAVIAVVDRPFFLYSFYF